MKPKFIIGVGMIVAAMLAVITFAIIGNSNLEVSVNDVRRQVAAGAAPDRALKLSGLVVGDSITYDARTLKLEFDIVQDHDQLKNNLSKADRVRVVYTGSKPDTLEHEAKAIITGRMQPDGSFHAGNSADALLVQCPTKYVAAN